MYDCPKCGTDLFEENLLQKLEGEIVTCPKCKAKYKIVLEYVLTAVLVEIGEKGEL